MERVAKVHSLAEGTMKLSSFAGILCSESRKKAKRGIVFQNQHGIVPLKINKRLLPCCTRNLLLNSRYFHAPIHDATQLRAPEMKVTIRSWHSVATWRWDMPEDDVCGICRVQFDGTCPTCKYPGDECTLCMLYTPQKSLRCSYTRPMETRERGELKIFGGSTIADCKGHNDSDWQMRAFISYGMIQLRCSVGGNLKFVAKTDRE